MTFIHAFFLLHVWGVVFGCGACYCSPYSDLGVYPLSAVARAEQEEVEEEEEEEYLDLEGYDEEEQFNMEFRWHKDSYYKEKMNYRKVTP